MRSASVVIIGGEAKPQSSDKPPAPQKMIDQTGTIPSINLDKGFDKIPTGRPKLHGSADKRKSNEILNSELDRKQGRARPGKNQITGTSAPLRTAAAQPESNGSYESYVQPEQQHQRQRQRSPKLNTAFRRDTGAAQRPRGTAKQRMMEDSQVLSRKVAPIGESSGSEDDLQGGNTVGSQMSYGMPPQKKGRKSGKSTTQQALSSPNHIIPTDFTQSRKKRDIQQSASKQYQNDEDEDPLPLSMLIGVFYASSCVIKNGPISLVYHPEGNELEVF
ncbi:hypothetical protein LTR08_008832 [Meristemomyces frigidus]|nr:hypothetical protein LTR08_008832 [Meristemomyces frigidus]